jgi:hypothetical protein
VRASDKYSPQYENVLFKFGAQRFASLETPDQNWEFANFGQIARAAR